MPRLNLSELMAPDRTALILQEVQNGVVGEQSALPALAEACARIGVLPHIVQLAAAARRVGVSVVHCTAENLPNSFGGNRNARLFAGALKAGAENAPGTESVMPIAGVAEPDDIILPRYHGLSPFTGGPLDSLLRNQGITTIVVVGVSLNVAIQNVVFDAVNRSYQVVVVTDAVAGVPESYGEQILENTLRLLATLATTEEVVAAWSASAVVQPG
jgi:nicotinamidase-related amidase